MLDECSVVQFVKIYKSGGIFIVNNSKESFMQMIDSICLQSITFCSCLNFSVHLFLDFEVVNWCSWFWKSLSMVNRGGAFSYFRGIHVSSDIRIEISISISLQAGTSKGFESKETYRAGAGKVITSRSRDKLKTLKLHYQSAYHHQTWLNITYLDGFLPTMSHDLLITSCSEITWQTQTILWPPMLEGVWSIKRGSLPQSHVTFHPLYLHYNSAYGRKTWRDCDLPWASSTHKVTWAYNYVVLRDTCQTKIIISPLTQCLHNVYNDVYNGYII